MRCSRRVLCGLFACTLFLTLTTVRPVSAIELGRDKLCAAIKVGHASSGDMSYSSLLQGVREGRAFSESMLGVSFDYPIGLGFHLGAALDSHPLHWRLNSSMPSSSEVSCTLVEFGVALKKTVYARGSRFVVRPGIGVGGGPADTVTLYRSFITYRATLELLVGLSGPMGVGLEAGLWRTLSGSDNTNDISIGPLSFVRVEFLISGGD